MITRRQFLTRAAAGTLSLASLQSAAWAAESKPSECPVVVFSKIFQDLKMGFEEAADLTAEAGLDGIDCPVRPRGEILPENATRDLPRYAEVLAKRRLRIGLLTTAITSGDSPHAREILEAARDVGVRHYRLGYFQAPKPENRAKAIADAQKQFEGAAALSKSTGMCALFQNHGGSLGGNLEEIIEVVKPFDPDQLGLAFDIGHALVVHGNDWRRYWDQLKSHLKVAYIKDAKIGGSWVPFGQGSIQNSGYLKLLKDLGYSAPFSLHIEFDWDDKGRQRNRAALLKALKESTTALRSWLASV